MNDKKRLFEQSRMKEELRALRAEEPNESAVDRSVHLMQSSPAPRARKKSRLVWRATALVTAVSVLGVLMSLRPQSANASVLHQIAEAVRAQHNRYQKTFRPQPNGELKQASECWLEGEKQFSLYDEDLENKSMTGYDGHRMFVYYAKTGGFIDDVAPSAYPIEDIDTYIQIPGARILGVVDKLVGGKKLLVYSIGFKTMKFDLFIDPATRLPVRRDVLTINGRLIERNIYEYPADIPESRFAVPAGLVGKLTDYPRQREVLAKRLELPGHTLEIGGVQVTLRSVIVGKSRVIALWTGGAKGEFLQEGSLSIEGQPNPVANGMPATFSVGAAGDPSKPELYVQGQPLRGDGAWYADLSQLKTPFKLNVAVWTEDRTRPLADKDGKPIGFRSKFIGRLQFDVTDVIRADDPERVIWRQKEDAATVATTK